MKKTGVSFLTEDNDLQRVYDLAESGWKKNIKSFGDKKLTITGAGYDAIWPETTPVEGRLLYGRDLNLAVQSQLIWMETQRRDGCVPGMIQQFYTTAAACQPGIEPQIAGYSAIFGWIQGIYFARTALEMYYLAELDNAYLETLYDCLSRYDDYLWKARDEDHNGCLESWCEWDLGDDNALRYQGGPYGCPEGIPPQNHPVLPMESTDMMSISYSCRITCAKIAAILQNGHESEWKGKAGAVQEKIRTYLWREEKNACYNRNRNNQFMDELEASNLRALYFGSFTQDMADRFIRHHLKNPDEFWTELPLPSVARNNPWYRQDENFSSMSGPTTMLHYMRTVLGLEDYGYPAEVTELMKRLYRAVRRDDRYEPFFDPQTTLPIGMKTDGRSTPGMLSMLTMIAMTYGVWIKPEGEICFSAIESDYSSVYRQIWGDDCYEIKSSGIRAEIFINGNLIAEIPTGFRLVTDKKGQILRIIRIEDSPKVFEGLGIKRSLSANESVAF